MFNNSTHYHKTSSLQGNNLYACTDACYGVGSLQVQECEEDFQINAVEPCLSETQSMNTYYTIANHDLFGPIVVGYYQMIELIESEICDLTHRPFPRHENSLLNIQMHNSINDHINLSDRFLMCLANIENKLSLSYQCARMFHFCEESDCSAEAINQLRCQTLLCHENKESEFYIRQLLSKEFQIHMHMLQNKQYNTEELQYAVNHLKTAFDSAIS